MSGTVSVLGQPVRTGLAEPPTPADLAAIREQLGRPSRGVRAVVARCTAEHSGPAAPESSAGTGHPAVVETEPRLPDGTPFPTVFYLTCPALSSAIGRLEASGLMREWTRRLGEDRELAEAYRQAHDAYLAHREAIADVPEIAGVSAGGMPDRVKCLHALVAHSLAVGPGVNPLGDEALALLAAPPPPQL